MEKETSLSEKMNKWVQPIDKEVKDVREAVKRLKKRLMVFARFPQREVHQIIDEIFGEKLI